MSKTCNVNCKILDNIDLFGKEPELYYKGNSKQTSWVGKLLSILYLLIYMSFFLYKIIRMLKKVDVTFYETSTFTGETPSIDLNNEIFYGGFALADPDTLLTFVDERIYYPMAFFRVGKKEGINWNWKTIPLDIEICKLEKFGKNYRDIFQTKDLNNLYCLKDMDVTLEGHITYDTYSLFYIVFYPCVNTTYNNYMCAPLEEIENRLTKSMVSVKIQDIELTPENYGSPTKVRGKELSSPAYINLYQNINAYFHIIHVETDSDMIGFGLFDNIQTKKYFKYDDTFILPSINNNDILNNPNQPIADITIQLSEEVITIKRANTKLIDVLGDVGGLMEVIFSIFKIITSFLSETLYEQSLINNLFSFDLDKKVISIKPNKTKKKNIFPHNEEIKVYSPHKPYKSLILPHKDSIFANDEPTTQTRNKLNEDLSTKRASDIILTKEVKPKKKKKKAKKKVLSAFSKGLSQEFNLLDNNLKKEEKLDTKNNMDSNNINTIISKDGNKLSEETKQTIENEKRNIINKIKLNKFCIYCCFLCVRKQKKMQNILIDEGMNIISERLDILYLFRVISKFAKFQEKFDETKIIIDMSDECKNDLKEIYRKKFNMYI